MPAQLYRHHGLDKFFRIFAYTLTYNFSDLHQHGCVYATGTNSVDVYIVTTQFCRQRAGKVYHRGLAGVIPGHIRVTDLAAVGGDIDDCTRFSRIDKHFSERQAAVVRTDDIDLHLHLPVFRAGIQISPQANDARVIDQTIEDAKMRACRR